MPAVIHIGNTIEKGELESVASAIVSIMEVRSADQKTIRAGLAAFGRMGEIKNISLSNMCINSNPDHSCAEEAPDPVLPETDDY